MLIGAIRGTVTAGFSSPEGTTQVRVAITAASALVGEVFGVSALWRRVLKAESIGGESLPAAVLAAEAQLSSADQRWLSRQQLLGLAVAETAWVQSGIGGDRQSLRGESTERLMDPSRMQIGVVSASALGSASALVDDLYTKNKRPGPTSLGRWRGNSLGAVTALRFGLQGDQFNLNAASSTGAQALALAGRCIRSGDLDAVLVVGAEPTLQGPLREANRRSRAMAEDHASVPLTSSRTGMRPVEAAGCLLLESEQRAKQRGAEVLAWLRGSSSGCEAHHLVAPQPGQQLSRAVFDRLKHQGILQDGDTIDWLALHATGTPRFDREEAAFVASAFQPLPWLTAFKQVLGHGLGAAGVVEAALLVEGLCRGTVPPWPMAIDPSLGLPVDPPSSAPVPQLALQLSAGMGGVVAMNLLERSSAGC